MNVNDQMHIQCYPLYQKQVDVNTLHQKEQCIDLNLNVGQLQYLKKTNVREKSSEFIDRIR